MSVMRKEDERLMQCLRIFWSTFSAPEEEPADEEEADEAA